MKPLRLGTRGSRLALWQAGWVRDLLEQQGCACEIVTLQTSGDRHQTGPLAAVGGKGLFTKELETALQADTIDLAVHSLKDVPSTLAAEFELAAYLPRADARDCLVCASTGSLSGLPVGCRLGSSSPRRIAQVRATCPAIEVVNLRGNVETRLNKVRSGEVGATLLAQAGLDRLEIQDPELLHVVPLEAMVPAAGQGIVAIETRQGDASVCEVLAGLDHAPTRLQAEVERAVVQALSGSCNSPLAVHAEVTGEDLKVTAFVGHPSGAPRLKQTLTGTCGQATDLAQQLAGDLLAAGADEILRQCEQLLSEQPDG